jgi:hypothetical protein
MFTYIIIYQFSFETGEKECRDIKKMHHYIFSVICSIIIVFIAWGFYGRQIRPTQAGCSVYHLYYSYCSTGTSRYLPTLGEVSLNFNPC